jgi:hypothetical protein
VGRTFAVLTTVIGLWLVVSLLAKDGRGDGTDAVEAAAGSVPAGPSEAGSSTRRASRTVAGRVKSAPARATEVAQVDTTASETGPAGLAPMRPLTKITIATGGDRIVRIPDQVQAATSNASVTVAVPVLVKPTTAPSPLTIVSRIVATTQAEAAGPRTEPPSSLFLAARENAGARPGIETAAAPRAVASLKVKAPEPPNSSAPLRSAASARLAAAEGKPPQLARAIGAHEGHRLASLPPPPKAVRLAALARAPSYLGAAPLGKIASRSAIILTSGKPRDARGVRGALWESARLHGQ